MHKDGAKCTNTPLECSACPPCQYVLKYGMAAHWDTKHGGEPSAKRRSAAAAWAMGEREIAFMSGLQVRRPNA